MIIDGKKLASDIKEGIAEKVADMGARGYRRPAVALVLVGDDAGSRSYVMGKVADAESVGIEGRFINFPASIPESELLSEIARMNADEAVDGIMVQLPLPPHIDEAKVTGAIAPDKDVDGFHPLNVARLWSGDPGIVPCTPKGIMHILDTYGVEIEGKRAVVVGRSNIVGLPVSRLLLGRNATVTLAHSLTPDLGSVTSKADILVVATGQHSLITGDMLKPGAVVIDVGITRNPETGKVQGDTVFDSCSRVASLITPVPGGVGPLTKACLMQNTLESYLHPPLTV